MYLCACACIQKVDESIKTDKEDGGARPKVCPEDIFQQWENGGHPWEEKGTNLTTTPNAIWKMLLIYHHEDSCKTCRYMTRFHFKLKQSKQHRRKPDTDAELKTIHIHRGTLNSSHITSLTQRKLIIIHNSSTSKNWRQAYLKVSLGHITFQR